MPATGRGGLWGCEIPRIPHCPDNWLGCQPYTPAALYHQKSSGSHFCYRLSKPNIILVFTVFACLANLYYL
jgi:hypothetical protein